MPQPGSNEATATYVSQDRIVLNARNQKGDIKTRIMGLSKDGGAHWDTVYFDHQLPDPVCEGAILNIGKHKGKVIEDLFKTEPGYFSWIQNADFPNYTKKVLRDLKNRISNKTEGPITDDSLNMLKNKFNTK